MGSSSGSIRRLSLQARKIIILLISLNPLSMGIMRIVSLVPSWTETLISWGAPVVGRTRFCIHPKEAVATIPPFGGTKNPHFAKINALQPDLVIVDREENNQDVQDKIYCPLHVTHVRGLGDMVAENQKLAQCFSEKVRATGLEQAQQWRHVLEKNPSRPLDQIPGVIQWWRRPQSNVRKIYYVIWKNPWMGIAPQTFIGSVFDQLGYGDLLPQFKEPYPTLELKDLRGSESLLLFSSEPFPFLKHREELLETFPNPMAFVDGESFSWFGVRSLRFLQNVL